MSFYSREWMSLGWISSDSDEYRIDFGCLIYDSDLADYYLTQINVQQIIHECSVAKLILDGNWMII